MECWQIAHQYIDDLKEKYKKEDPEYIYPCVTGALSSDLSSIFINLSVYYPEAYEFIIKNFKRKEEGYVSN